MNFDKSFREKLHTHEEQPQDHIWAKLSMMLDEKDDEKKVIPILPTKQKSGWYIYSAAASFLFLVVTVGVWLSGRQGTDSVERLAGRQGVKSVERLAGRQEENQEYKITYQDTTSNKKYSPNPNKTRENKQNKTQENKTPNNTPKKQENKSKTFRPLPTRTELIATIQDYQPKVKIEAIEQEPEAIQAPFEGAIVTAVFQSDEKAQKKRKNNFFSRNFLGSKNREAKPKRKIKVLGFDVEKAFAKR